MNPTASIVVPSYNATATLSDTLRSLLAQTFEDFEILVIDDGSTDGTRRLAESFDDPRIRIVSQRNRGLAGARNSGIHHARGAFVGFCDADDMWVPEKLERHVAHLVARPQVGLSYAGAILVDGGGEPIGITQTPKLRGIDAAHVFCRNPVGNGSAAVFRREALDALAHRPVGEQERDWWFDERLRQSEDIEAWIRFALSSDWEIEGIEGHLTLYRIHSGGLSANIASQFESWCKVRDVVKALAPDFEARVGPRAAAFQFRYLSRRAVRMGDGGMALELLRSGAASSLRAIVSEPLKSAATLAAALALRFAGRGIYRRIEMRLLAPR